MKKKYIIFLIILLPNLWACENFLDEVNPADVTTDFLYSTKAGLQNAAAGLYAIERDRVNDNSEGQDFALIMGDCGTDLDFTRAAVGTNVARYRLDVNMAGEAAVKSWWRKWYTIIERANSIITYGKQADISEADKKAILRETYIHRANAYFWLVRKYDNIWLNLDPTNYSNISGRTYEPAKQEDVYKVIVSDLDSAISYFGTNWNAIPGQYGLGAALFLRIDVALWQKDYETASKLAVKIIEQGPYELVEPASIFTKDGRNSSKETIYALQFDAFAMGGGKAHRMPLTFTTQTRTIKGMIMVSEYGGYGWSRVTPNEYLTSLYDSIYDKRYDAYWQHYYRYNDPNFAYTSYKLGDTIKMNPTITSTNYYAYASVSCKKYWDWVKAPNVTVSSNNIIIYRFAEVYLMAAEAFFRIGTPEALTKARYYINLLRFNRINAGASNRLFVSLTEDRLMAEYAREMAFEGRRWFMLKRFDRLVDQVRLHGGQSSFRGVPAPSADFYAARTNIQDFHVRWPIPQAEIDAMGGTFPQNEGYY
jgi:hypothetical protein